MLLSHETFHLGLVPHFLHSRRDQAIAMEGYHLASPKEKDKLEGKLKIPPWLKKSRLINGTLSGRKTL